MKKALFVLFFFTKILLFAQNNYDLTWALGYGNIQGDTTLQGVNIVFTKDGVKSFLVKRNLRIDEYNTTGNDKNGNLQFYFNGCSVYNRFDKPMENGTGLLTGYSSINSWCNKEGYLPAGNNASMVLPISDSIYYLIYQHDGYLDGAGIVPLWLRYAQINTQSRNGRGEVEDKRKIIISKPTDSGHLTAVKKTDGKSWWIIVPDSQNGKYFFASLSADGTFKNELKNFGFPGGELNNGSGGATISPNGKKYARWDKKLGIYLMDLDRDKGELKNFKKLETDSIVSLFLSVGSVCFSPNSRYLYVSDTWYINQFDTEATDIQASMVRIAPKDNNNHYNYMQQGADCKIYVTAGKIGYFHVIDQPNQKSKACNFLLRGLKLPVTLSDAIPYFPNYRLDTPDEHWCDSLKVSNKDIEKEPFMTCAVYPNPAQEQVNIDLFGYVQSYQQGNWLLYDATGKIAASFPILQGHDQYNYDIAHLPQGLYVWNLVLDNKIRQVGKLVKMD
jgi:hypothetical protein